MRIAPSALRHVRRGHPWIFDQSIERISHDGQPGDLAVVFDDKRDFAAIGLWDPTSPIRIRVLATHQTSVGPELWRTRIKEAIERRRELVDDDEVTGLRWLHGENDRVPGLVVDGYGSTLVVKLYTSAWLAHLDDVVDALAEHLEPERVILRLARAVPATPGRADGDVIFGEPADGSVAFLENGHTMTADPVEGQKTGYFLDQRSNRRSFGDLAGAGDVLDVFCCHGGLSPEMDKVKQVLAIKRPSEVPEKGLLCDLLWSDPEADISGWAENDRGVSYTFGADVVSKFLQKHDYDLIVRAHQVVEDGYEFFADRQLVTIFSAPNYCGEFDNAGAVRPLVPNRTCPLAPSPVPRVSCVRARAGHGGGREPDVLLPHPQARRQAEVQLRWHQPAAHAAAQAMSNAPRPCGR